MKLDTQRLKAAGFQEDEIRQIKDYCDAALRAGRFSNVAAVIRLNDKVRWVNTTIAEILDQLRPGCWLDRPDDHPGGSASCGEDAQRGPEDEPTRKLWSELESKLFAIGGTRAVWVGEPCLQALVERGHVFDQPIKFFGMLVNHCHENAAVLWSKDVHGTRIGTGYGLGPDGLWRQHSWAVKDKQLLETNVPMIQRYFGIELSPLASLKFWYDNYLRNHYPKGGPEAMKCIQRYPQLQPLLKKARKECLRRKRGSLQALFNK